MSTAPVTADLRRNGDVSGTVAISRYVLEWRLDVTNPHRLKEITADDHDQEIVPLCTDGDSSCLAAHQVSNSLRLTNVHNVSGGFVAWCAAGLPVPRRPLPRGADLDD